MTEPVDEPLDLEFEVEEDESTSSSEEEGDSDNDHGEVGEMGMQEDEVSVADEDEAQLLQTLAYQDEPEPRDPGRAGGDVAFHSITHAEGPGMFVLDILLGARAQALARIVRKRKDIFADLIIAVTH